MPCISQQNKTQNSQIFIYFYFSSQQKLSEKKKTCLQTIKTRPSLVFGSRSGIYLQLSYLIMFMCRYNRHKFIRVKKVVLSHGK